MIERGWIDVNDDFPPMGINVLCCGPKGGMYIGRDFNWSAYLNKVLAYNQCGATKEVNFWMPLPKPKKVKKCRN